MLKTIDTLIKQDTKDETRNKKTRNHILS